ncbi:heavy-metal-associated domain-containing protein [Paenibacillus sp. CMAA1364]
MKTMTLQLEQLTCPSCIKKIEKALGNQEGIHEVKVLFTSSKVKVQYDTSVIASEAISKIVTKLGFQILNTK